MTTPSQHHDSNSAELAGPDVFSAEPERRAVEVAFLVRMVEAAGLAGASILKKAQASSFGADFAAMQSPVFENAARILERSVAHDAGFGRFRDKSKDGQ